MTDAYQGGLPADQVGPPPKTASATIRLAAGPQDAATGSQPLSGTQRLHDARVDRQVRLALDLATLRDQWRKVTSTLGYGDGITEPQATPEQFITAMEAAEREASEWRESQRWLNDCAAAGCSDSQDCHLHNPVLRLTAERDRARGTAAQLEAEVAICNALIPDLGRMAAKGGVLLAERDAARAQAVALTADLAWVRRERDDLAWLQLALNDARAQVAALQRGRDYASDVMPMWRHRAEKAEAKVAAQAVVLEAVRTLAERHEPGWLAAQVRALLPPAPEPDWLDHLRAWAATDDAAPLDFRGASVPSKMQALLSAAFTPEPEPAAEVTWLNSQVGISDFHIVTRPDPAAGTDTEEGSA